MRRKSASPERCGREENFSLTFRLRLAQSDFVAASADEVGPSGEDFASAKSSG
jgi:hypothetical protein